MRYRYGAKNDVSEDIDCRTRIQVIDIVNARSPGCEGPSPRHRPALEYRHKDTTNPQSTSDEKCGVHDQPKILVLDEA
jgi:hypothetical protein